MRSMSTELTIMRLLNVKTFELEEFVSDDVPDYTILSHTWGDEEVSFQDLTSGNYKHLRGYRKVEGCCATSRREGFRYTWIDTCCIDKSSSSELSESINSMFEWYKRSAVCYALLCDVHGEEPLADGSGFAQSRWFTRGWTLQELIAPEIVVFLQLEMAGDRNEADVDWRCIRDHRNQPDSARASNIGDCPPGR